MTSHHAWLTRALAAQAGYYIVTGAWPLVYLRSFIMLVGPKPDLFQLFITSGLIVVIGLVLWVGRDGSEAVTIRLSLLSAATLGAASAFGGIHRRVFWLDTVVEFVLLGTVGALANVAGRARGATLR